MNGYCEVCGETVCVCEPCTNDEMLNVLLACLPNAPFKDRFTESVSKLKQERDEAVALVEVLKSGYAECVEDVEHWAAYADEYFREKWRLAEDIAKHNAILSIAPSAALREIQARALEESRDYFNGVFDIKNSTE